MTVELDTLTWVGIFTNVASLILSILAIFLALYFYDKSKNAEKEITNALTAIRAESQALQKLTGRWMDRFTRHATEPRQLDEGMMQLIQVVASLPQTLLTHVHLRTETTTTNNDALIQELVNSYIAIHWYAGVANLLGQQYLPNVDEFDVNDPKHIGLQSVVDRAAADFQTAAERINSAKRDVVDRAHARAWLDESNQYWAPSVKNSKQIFQEQKLAKDRTA